MTEIIRRPLGEINGMSVSDASMHVRNVVVGGLDIEQQGKHLVSGFDGSTSLIQDVYQPTGEYIQEGLMDGRTVEDWLKERPGGLRDVGHYAVRYPNPAVGVYDPQMFNQVAGHSYRIKPEFTVLGACSVIYVWG